MASCLRMPSWLHVIAPLWLLFARVGACVGAMQVMSSLLPSDSLPPHSSPCLRYLPASADYVAKVLTTDYGDSQYWPANYSQSRLENYIADLKGKPAQLTASQLTALETLRWGYEAKHCAASTSHLLVNVMDVAVKEAKQCELGNTCNLGLVVDYATLPGSVPVVVQQHFRTPLSSESVARMVAEGEHYSKARGRPDRLQRWSLGADVQSDSSDTFEFHSDAEAKHKLAHPAVRFYAETIPRAHHGPT